MHTFRLPLALMVAIGLVAVSVGCRQNSGPEYGREGAGPEMSTQDRNTPEHGGQDHSKEMSKKDQVRMLQKHARQLGYLKAHRRVSKPMSLLGGPITVHVRQAEGGVHVALPDHRKIDPRVFGTPKMPQAVFGSPIVTGLPPMLRGTDGKKYTQVKQLSPFGDKHVVMANGKMHLRATDATATDAKTSEDQVEFEASWQDEKGNTYAVRCGKVIPAGLEYPVFGGVVTNHILHGFSGVGTPLMPTEFAYVAFWGKGNVLKNGEVVDNGRIVHGMLTEYVRTEGYKLGFDKDVTPTRRHFHLMVAPVKPKGGHFANAPVKTGFTLPNGKKLPFWHVMFANLVVNSYREGQEPHDESTDEHGDSHEGGSDHGSGADKPAQTVGMTNTLKYDPAGVTVNVGDTVLWKNSSNLAHTVTADPDKANNPDEHVKLPAGAEPFDSGTMSPGDTFRHTFAVAGKYKYFCIPHEAAGMVGTVTVRE